MEEATPSVPPVTEEPQPVPVETPVNSGAVVEEPAAGPEVPVWMRPEDYDPYGPPTFVECWENNAALMSDGSIVADTQNCALDQSEPQWDA